MVLHGIARCCIVLYGIVLHCTIVGFGARAVSRKTPIYFMSINRITSDPKFPSDLEVLDLFHLLDFPSHSPLLEASFLGIPC